MSNGHVRHRAEHPQAESRTAIPPTEPVSFSLVLRYPPSKQQALEKEAVHLLAGGRPTATRADAAAAREADPADIAIVRAFCEKSGLTVDSIAAESRTVHVTGRASTVNALFDIVLMDARHGATHWREYDGEPHVPRELRPSVEAVLGLSTKAIA